MIKRQRGDDKWLLGENGKDLNFMMIISKKFDSRIFRHQWITEEEQNTATQIAKFPRNLRVV